MAPPKQRKAANNIRNKKPSSKPPPSKPQNVCTKPQEPSSSIPPDLQQLVLNIFKTSFAQLLETDFAPLLQEVKGHLYNRDFLTAFGRNDYLEVYAARWSPSRALGYLEIFDYLSDQILPTSQEVTPQENSTQKIVCLGGGAGAEVVALGGFLDLLQRTDTRSRPQSLDVVAIDIANWSAIVETLQKNATTAPPISKYASDAAKAANLPLLKPDSFHVSFHQADVLNTSFSELAPNLEEASLVTLLFTLNELYSTSISLTQKFLLSLTSCLRKGSLLLVVDSPGSYSTVCLNNTEKKYPMQWLMDHTLLRHTDKREDPPWTKIKEDESRWFRLLPTLNYPMELENMRYQLHLYRRD